MKRLTARLRELAGADGKICVAFSGGVDSALLVKLCCNAGLETHAVTFDSTLQPLGESAQAAALAQEYGAKHIVLWGDPLTEVAVRQNRRDRCYRCKHLLFSTLKEYARSQQISAVIDGTNADDHRVYRPGLRALQELAIASPLAELKVTKPQVRALAEQLEMSVAKKPSGPCMATRFPYDTPLMEKELARVNRAEALLHAQGFAVVRVRVHGNTARIEVPVGQLGALAERAEVINAALRAEGYKRVTLDLAGFRSGSFDEDGEKK